MSGLLYKANVLMYDRQSESLWSQVRREAVGGPMTGARLEVLESTLTTWGKWKKKYPQTQVLSLETGYQRDYTRDPYESYYESRKGFFSFFKADPSEEEKALVAGIVLDGEARAYPLELLRKKGGLTDTLEEARLAISFDAQTDRISIRDAEGQTVPHVILYWFVWKGMYPESTIFKP